MGGKGGSQTIGYHYFFDILWGLNNGPINELVEIKVGDKTAWTGSLSDNTMSAIIAPKLFGGEKKEGGIQGPFRLFMGEADQILPGEASINCGSSGPYKGSRKLPDVKTTIGGRVSEMRGQLMLWYSGLVSSMNPYLKEWAFRERRYNAGWYNDNPWYPNMARILMAGGTIHAMNPAHIIYECLTNPSWGRGLPASFIDENSFILAANTLCDEGFGLCFLWARKEDISVFIRHVQEHIAAELYPDPETGKMVLKLLRKDYVAEDLPLFTPESGLLEITEDDASSQDAIFNGLIGKGRDPITNQDFQIRTHNLAARQSQGAGNPETKEYPGIPTRDLMARVLQRDLKLHASGLKRLNIKLDGRGWRIRTGMPFRIQDTRRGINNMIVRAVEITDNLYRKNEFVLKVMQDVHGMPSTSFVTPTEPEWEPPVREALAATSQKMVEANYRDVFLRTSSAVAADAEGSGIIGVMAVSPDPLMYSYELATKASGETDFEERGSGTFTGAATLTDEIGPYDTEFTLTGVTDFPDAADLIGQVILIGNEQVGVVAFDEDTNAIEVVRGVGDTVPTEHAAATSVWTQDDDASSDLREYAPGETVEAVVLTQSPGDTLDIEDATPMSIGIVGRLSMPYPPGDVRVDGDPALTLVGEYPEPEFTWTHRDRILQQEQIVGHTEGSVGPEDGTTYTIRLYDYTDPMGTPIRTESLIAGTSWQYLTADQITDGTPFAVWVELESVRDGLESYQKYRFLVILNLVTFDDTTETFDSDGITFDMA